MFILDFTFLKIFKAFCELQDINYKYTMLDKFIKVKFSIPLSPRLLKDKNNVSKSIGIPFLSLKLFKYSMPFLVISL
jgi:hypothetical protein